MDKKKFGDLVIHLLENNANLWRFDDRYAKIGTLEIRMEGGLYPQLSVAGRKIGTWMQRRKIKRIMFSMAVRNMASAAGVTDFELAMMGKEKR